MAHNSLDQPTAKLLKYLDAKVERLRADPFTDDASFYEANRLEREIEVYRAAAAHRLPASWEPYLIELTSTYATIYQRSLLLQGLDKVDIELP